MNAPYDIQIVRTTAFHGGAEQDESTFHLDLGTANGDCLTDDQLLVLMRAIYRALKASGMDTDEITFDNEEE